MKKSVNTYAILGLIILGFLFLFFIIQFPMTGKIIEEPPIPENCSEDMIKNLWENIFKGSSENIIIVPLYNTSNQTEVEEMQTFSELYGGCPLYIAYEINGNQLKMLNGVNMWFFADMKVVLAYIGNFNQESINNLTNKNDPGFGGGALQTSAGFIFEKEFIENNIVPREITTVQEAKNHFESIFNIQVQNWSKMYDEQLGEIGMYNFVENETLENITIFGQEIDPKGIHARMGVVLENYSLDVYIFTEVSVNGMLINLAKSIYANWTSPINTSLENITVNLNGSKLDMNNEFNMFSEGPSGIQKLEILENNKTIVETEIDFTSNDIDYTQIILKKQPSTHKTGYVIINGINESKNVTVDKLSSKSDSVCIKEAEITFISEISEDCDDSDETLLECPTQNPQKGFTCEIINNTFFVTGLMHSAVSEYLEKGPCFPQWSCNIWSNSKDECGYRTCTDLNDCRDLTGIPEEYKKCPPICIPNWECTDWEPEKCPKEEERTRTCQDINNCGKDNEIPQTSMSCEYENNALLWVSLSILVLLLVLLLAVGLSSSRRNREMQEMTHNPDPDNEIHEHELPTQGDFSEEQNQQTYQQEPYQEPIKKEFNEFKQNPRIQADKKQLPKQHELPKRLKEDLKPKERSQFRSKNKGDFYLP